MKAMLVQVVGVAPYEHPQIERGNATPGTYNSPSRP
jgi:hypothetical protein